jgi:hypothetical protein
MLRGGRFLHPENPDRPTTRNPLERERILSFATIWLPYGGGPAEDIWVKFGLTVDAYYRRLGSILTDSEHPCGLDPGTVAALLELCRRRI